MSKLTEKQLIESLKSLKGIKPRQEWVSLLKSEILICNSKTNATAAKFANFNFGFGNLLKNLDLGFRISSKRLAYSFAAVLILIAGAFTLANLSVFEKTPQKLTASLTGQAGLSQNVVALNTKINSLAKSVQINKTANTSAIKDISANAKDLAQNLKNNPSQDPATLNAIATSLKTLADVSGTDLTANPDVQNLYQAVVQSQIADLQKTTLTDAQKKILANAEDLYKQGKYADALEAIYNINANQKITTK